MRLRLALIAAALLCGPTLAHAASCESLYVQRNAIYKEAGYCFRTPRAIRTFGNAGCQFDDVADVPLTTRQRAFVADLKAQEQMGGCSD